MPRKRLADDVRLEVLYEDTTPFGSAIGGKADDAIRRACASVCADDAQRSMDDLVRRSKELPGRPFEHDLASRYVRPGVLREDCLFPAADRVRPYAVLATREKENLVGLG